MLSPKNIRIPLLSLSLLFNVCIASDEQAKPSSSASPNNVLNIVTPVWKNFTEADGSGFWNN